MLKTEAANRTGRSVCGLLHYAVGMEVGYDIRSIQELLGHSDVKITMVCTTS